MRQQDRRIVVLLHSRNRERERERERTFLVSTVSFVICEMFKMVNYGNSPERDKRFGFLWCQE